MQPQSQKAAEALHHLNVFRFYSTTIKSRKLPAGLLLCSDGWFHLTGMHHSVRHSSMSVTYGMPYTDFLDKFREFVWCECLLAPLSAPVAADALHSTAHINLPCSEVKETSVVQSSAALPGLEVANEWHVLSAATPIRAESASMARPILVPQQAKTHTCRALLASYWSRLSTYGLLCMCSHHHCQCQFLGKLSSRFKGYFCCL